MEFTNNEIQQYLWRKLYNFIKEQTRTLINGDGIQSWIRRIIIMYVYKISVLLTNQFHQYPKEYFWGTWQGDPKIYKEK